MHLLPNANREIPEHRLAMEATRAECRAAAGRRKPECSLGSHAALEQERWRRELSKRSAPSRGRYNAKVLIRKWKQKCGEL
jgi:hypothetical protein